MQLGQGGGRLDSGKMGKVRLDLGLSMPTGFNIPFACDILAQSFVVGCLSSTNSDTVSAFPPHPTFFALQCHPGLQVVHLHLQTLEGEVAFSGFALVRNQHSHDEDDEQAAGHRNADNSWQAERAVWRDVDHPWGELHPSYTSLEGRQERVALKLSNKQEHRGTSSSPWLRLNNEFPCLPS